MVHNERTLSVLGEFKAERSSNTREGMGKRIRKYMTKVGRLGASTSEKTSAIPGNKVVQDVDREKRGKNL